MFKSLYRMQNNEGRLQPEAVLTGKGAIVMIILFLVEQAAAEGISLLVGLYDLPLGLMEINMIVNVGVLLAMCLFFHGFYLTNLKSYFKEFKAIYIWLPIVCYICSSLANVIISIILALVRGELQGTSNNELVTQLLNQYPAQLLLLTVIIAPITEESVFRAALSRSMTVSRRKWIQAMGFVLSILLFAFLHVSQFVFSVTDASGAIQWGFNFNEFLSIFIYIPMAVALTLCSYFGKNFWCSVFCHMLINGVAVTLSLLAGASR